jgi:hypothetical protein
MDFLKLIYSELRRKIVLVGNIDNLEGHTGSISTAQEFKFRKKLSPEPLVKCDGFLKINLFWVVAQDINIFERHN